ncbi:MAG: LptF/LptG family permease [Pedobacter agri]|uniref:LptF/LptG family permease n=1 Tax=Pedobacter agri TaxID=454586 RepID=A0A9X3I7R7_9SPHI|nr:LptF/LptG family permease [Pedobacter agri]MCX3263996.1 LptF/LptG family permease [Pedobacter agri]MDQ1141554.1 lipopolysaccharide export system permease protein [Pedobacter agri]
MKKIHLLLIKAFIKPFLATFFVVMFILLMFFLFKWIDDLIGKGFEWYTILELMAYASAANVSMALPLSVLLSSIMTFGTLGENYELVAIKSAGISLQKAMRPLFVVIIMLTIGSFLFSNYMLPKANLKFSSLLYDVRNKKLAFLIKPGVFNNSIPNYSIRVDAKDEDGTLHNIMIYDHKGTNGVPKVIMAKQGQMNKTADGKFLLLNLKDGVQYEEQPSSSGAYNPRQVFNRSRFKETEPRFDLSSFEMNRTDPNAFGNSTPMLNLKGITKKGDSLGKLLDTLNMSTDRVVANNFKQFNVTKGYSKVKMAPKQIGEATLNSIPGGSKKLALDNASNTVSGIMQNLANTGPRHDDLVGEIIFTRIEYQRKFTLAASCILLFFIGAPLGAIIRKGGMGLPVVIAISFFLVYHIITTVAEKSAREGNLNPIFAMWIAVIVLSPLAVFLTYKATVDSALFDVNYYKQVFNKLLRIKQKQA